MIIPSAAVMGHLLQHRERTLRFQPHRAHASTPRGLRVRLGHLLIAAGSSLSGDVVERHTPRHPLPRIA